MSYVNHKTSTRGCLLQQSIFISWLLLACACRFSPEDYHPKYFDSVFKKVDTAGIQGKEKAFAFMDSAFYSFPQPGTGDIYNRLRRIRDFYYHRKKDYLKGLEYNDSVINLLKGKINDAQFAGLYTDALFVKGDLYLLLKNYNESLHYYVLARQIMIHKVQDPCRLVGFMGRNARLYYTQGNYLMAAAAYMQCYREQSLCKKDDFLKFAAMQENLDNTGMCYNNLEMLDSADYYFAAALSFININGPRFPERKDFMTLARAVVYGNQASVLSKKKMYIQSEALFVQSVSGTINTDLPYTQMTLTNFATMYLNSNQVSKADTILGQLKFLLDSLPNEDALVKWYRLKELYYYKIKDHPLATRYITAYFHITDSLAVRDSRFVGMDIHREYESREQKNANELLEKSNKLQTSYVVIAVGATILFVIIILLVLNNLKYSARAIKQLRLLNKEISLKNQELYRAYTSLEQSHQQNNRIIKMVAHDLRNPVGAIQKLVRSLQKKDNLRHIKEVLPLMKEACSSSLMLIKDLLTDKDAAGKMRPLDMRNLVEYCAELLQAKADEKGQQIFVYADTVLITTDRQKMWRVISNLINNAVKFSPENAVINVRLQQLEKTVLLSVQDFGIGIPKELQRKIFSPLPEAKRAGTAGETSYGLGLYIAQKIVEEHKGRLWFESEEGNGATFYLELPLG